SAEASEFAQQAQRIVRLGVQLRLRPERDVHYVRDSGVGSQNLVEVDHHRRKAELIDGRLGLRIAAKVEGDGGGSKTELVRFAGCCSEGNRRLDGRRLWGQAAGTGESFRHLRDTGVIHVAAIAREAHQIGENVGRAQHQLDDLRGDVDLAAA